MVIDTGIFIEFLRKKDKTKTTLYSLPEIAQIAISSVTLYELFMGATDESKMKDVRVLTEDLMVLPFDEQVAKKSGEIYHQLRKTNKLIEFRDIFIAATCLVYEMPLKTLNQKHFERVSNLVIF